MRAQMKLVAAVVIICAGYVPYCRTPVMEKHGYVSENACSYKPVTTQTTEGIHTNSVKCTK